MLASPARGAPTSALADDGADVETVGAVVDWGASLLDPDASSSSPMKGGEGETVTHDEEEAGSMFESAS